MFYKTLEGMLHPDGTLIVPREELPDQSVSVLITRMARRLVADERH